MRNLRDHIQKLSIHKDLTVDPIRIGQGIFWLLYIQHHLIKREWFNNFWVRFKVQRSAKQSKQH